MATIRPWNFSCILSKLQLKRTGTYEVVRITSRGTHFVWIYHQIEKMDQQNIINSFITLGHVRHDTITTSVSKFKIIN